MHVVQLFSALLHAFTTLHTAYYCQHTTFETHSTIITPETQSVAYNCDDSAFFWIGRTSIIPRLSADDDDSSPDRYFITNTIFVIFHNFTQG